MQFRGQPSSGAILAGVLDFPGFLELVVPDRLRSAPLPLNKLRRWDVFLDFHSRPLSFEPLFAFGAPLARASGMSIRVAVVGAGHHGRHHARILSTLPGVALVAVVDSNPARAREIAAQSGAQPFYDAGAIMNQVDAVIVAAPTAVHCEIALPFLRAGVAALVEKPIARSLAEADAMISAAKATGAILAVGHSERFNPALAAVRTAVAEPRFIEVHRLGTFPERSLDIDVIYDLMIHDLDVVLSLVKSPVVSIEAVGVAVLTSRFDIANARVRFANGCIANLTASRISRDRVRKLRLFQPAAYVSIDFAAQVAQHWRLVKGSHDAAPTIQGQNVDVVSEEPLKRELTDFVAAVASRRPPLVTGEDGRRALELADQISARITVDHTDAMAMSGYSHL
jgi:predicted dehydrogenase